MQSREAKAVWCAEVAKLIQQLGMLIDLEKAPPNPQSNTERMTAPDGAIPTLVMEDFPQASPLPLGMPDALCVPIALRMGGV